MAEQKAQCGFVFPTCVGVNRSGPGTPLRRARLPHVRGGEQEAAASRGSPRCGAHLRLEGAVRPGSVLLRPAATGISQTALQPSLLPGPSPLGALAPVGMEKPARNRATATAGRSGLAA